MVGAGAGAGLLGPKAEKGKEKIKFLFYFLKHHFKSNLDSNFNPFANFDQPKGSQIKYAACMHIHVCRPYIQFYF